MSPYELKKKSISKSKIAYKCAINALVQHGVTFKFIINNNKCEFITHINAHVRSRCKRDFPCVSPHPSAQLSQIGSDGEVGERNFQFRGQRRGKHKQWKIRAFAVLLSCENFAMSVKKCWNFVENVILMVIKLDKMKIGSVCHVFFVKISGNILFFNPISFGKWKYPGL